MSIHTHFAKPLGFAALVFAGSLTLRASTVAVWDFENASVGQVSGIAASSASADVSSATFDTGNNGVEDFGGSIGQLSLTRFFSDFGNRFPFLTFTLTNAVDLTSISFTHYHNHNPGYPSYPSYDFELQFNDGSGWNTLGSGLAWAGSSGNTDTIAGPGVLGAGTYSLRWIGNHFSYGDDSNTEFFGLDDVTLTGDAVPEGTSSLALFVLAASLVLAARRRFARV